MANRVRRMCGAGILAAFWLLVVGCRTTADQVMRQNFERIEARASTRDDVGALLGSPEHRIGDTWMYTRPDRHLTVIVDFDAEGRVVRKQWIHGEEGTWEDSDDKE